MTHPLSEDIADTQIFAMCSHWEREAIEERWSRKDRMDNLAFIGVSQADYDAIEGEQS